MMMSHLTHLAVTARPQPAEDLQAIHAAELRAAGKKRRLRPLRPVIAGAARFGISGLGTGRAKNA